MNYNDAKTVLLQTSPRVPLKLFAFEAVALLGAAALMVSFFT